MPCTTGDIRIRLTAEQRDLLHKKAQAAGYATVSQFIRDRIFKEETELSDSASKRMIQEIHGVLCIQKADSSFKSSKLRRNKVIRMR